MTLVHTQLPPEAQISWCHLPGSGGWTGTQTLCCWGNGIQEVMCPGAWVVCPLAGACPLLPAEATVARGPSQTGLQSPSSLLLGMLPKGGALTSSTVTPSWLEVQMPRPHPGLLNCQLWGWTVSVLGDANVLEFEKPGLICPCAGVPGPPPPSLPQAGPHGGLKAPSTIPPLKPGEFLCGLWETGACTSS